MHTNMCCIQLTAQGGSQLGEGGLGGAYKNPHVFAGNRHEPSFSRQECKQVPHSIMQLLHEPSPAQCRSMRKDCVGQQV